MDSTSFGFEILTDLWQTIVKLLGRPAVQFQLIAGIGAIALAWFVARGIRRIVNDRNEARVETLREEILAEYLANLDVDVEDLPEGELIDSPESELDEQDIQRELRRRLGLRHPITLLFRQILFPLLAIIFVYAVYVIAQRQGWYSGILADMLQMLGVFFIYRLILGLVYMVADPVRVEYYQRRLFAPLVVVIITISILGTVFDLETLASTSLFPFEGATLTLGSLFLATFGFYVWIMGVSLFKDILKAFLVRRESANPGSIEASMTMVQYGLVAIGLFGVFQILQLNPATIAAATGGLAIGVGFALQDVIKNFLGGLIVLFEGSVRPGDWVAIAGTEGQVDKLSIRSTIVRTFDNVEYIVPNQDWLNSTVTTFTRNERRVRTRVPVSVSRDADPHFVQELLIETAKSNPEVLSIPEPIAPLVGFGESSIDFIVLAWVEDAMFRAKVAGALRLEIWDALKENGIEIPFPQRDLHLRTSLPGLEIEAPATEAGQNRSPA